MDLKEFAQYLKQTSFDAALHHVRILSFERILENELRGITTLPHAHHDHKQAKKTA